jgi:CRISPR/Cas system CMR-associated protein Cmr5 small subunit
LKGGAGNLMKNIKEASTKVMETVSAYVSKNTNLNNGLPCTIKFYFLMSENCTISVYFSLKNDLFMISLKILIYLIVNNCFREFYAFVKEMYII